MSEARRLLEEAASFCEERAPDNAPFNVRLGRTIRAYLAQPITKCEDLAAAICFLEHSKNTHENWAAWLADGKVASPDAGDLEHHRRCILEYEHILDVIQGTAREGELVAAMEDARMLCMNDHAYDNETSQVFEAVQVINRALADTPPAAALQGEDGKRLLQRYGSHLAWCRARNNLIPGAGKTECDCGFYAAALAPGGEPIR